MVLDINHKDHLVFGGCDVVELAKTYGTPVHIVCEDKLRSNYRRFLVAFKNHYPRLKAFYSYKTNCIPGVLKVLHEEGCGAEVVSPYELWLALRLGVKPSEIIYNGVNKSSEDLRATTQKGVGLINVDSADEVYRLMRVSEEVRQKVNVGIRIYPKVGWRAQFGIEPDRDQVVTLIKEMEKTGFLNPCCLQVHIGTDIRNTNPYESVIKEICSLLHEIKGKLNINIEYLDLGGGFGIPTVKTFTTFEVGLYKIFNIPPKGPKEKDCPSVETFGQVICNSLKKHCELSGLKEPYLLLEPGRAITSDAQILLLTVGDIKKRRDGAKFAVTDGGMQNIAFPLSYEYHQCLLANRLSTGPRNRYFLTGPLCSPQDLLYRNWRLPELQRGDILAIMDAGAYFTSFSNNFSYPKPAVVLISGDGHKLARQHESFEHMTAMDRIYV